MPFHVVSTFSLLYNHLFKESVLRIFRNIRISLSAEKPHNFHPHSFRFTFALLFIYFHPWIATYLACMLSCVGFSNWMIEKGNGNCWNETKRWNAGACSITYDHGLWPITFVFNLITSLCGVPAYIGRGTIDRVH